MSTDSRPNDLFLGLVASLQASAWMQLGKIVNPLSGKIERDLERAHETIDLLGVLEEKTRGNLHPDEARLLGQILYELRMNYVDELKRTASGASPQPQQATAGSDPVEASPPGSAPDSTAAPAAGGGASAGERTADGETHSTDDRTPSG